MFHQFLLEVKVLLKSLENKTVTRVVRNKRDVDNFPTISLQTTSNTHGNKMNNINIKPLFKKRQVADPLNVTTPQPRTTNQSSTLDGNAEM